MTSGKNKHLEFISGKKYWLVTGMRKREVGLVVPAKFSAFTKTKCIAIKLDEELKKRKEMLTYFELKYTQKDNVNRPCFE